MKELWGAEKLEAELEAAKDDLRGLEKNIRKILGRDVPEGENGAAQAANRLAHILFHDSLSLSISIYTHAHAHAHAHARARISLSISLFLSLSQSLSISLNLSQSLSISLNLYLFIFITPPSRSLFLFVFYRSKGSPHLPLPQPQPRFFRSKHNLASREIKFSRSLLTFLASSRPFLASLRRAPSSRSSPFKLLSDFQNPYRQSNHTLSRSSSTFLTPPCRPCPIFLNPPLS
jgi:hypothetical protein